MIQTELKVAENLQNNKLKMQIMIYRENIESLGISDMKQTSLFCN